MHRGLLTGVRTFVSSFYSMSARRTPRHCMSWGLSTSFFLRYVFRCSVAWHEPRTTEQAVGEYFLASAFEKVVVQKSGYVGLTGIPQQKLFLRRFFDKYGIKPEVFAREVRVDN